MRIARESERPIAAVARDPGIHHESLRVWVRQDEADDGSRNDRLTSAEREVLATLRRDVRDLRRSNEILKADHPTTRSCTEDGGRPRGSSPWRQTMIVDALELTNEAVPPQITSSPRSRVGLALGYRLPVGKQCD